MSVPETWKLVHTISNDECYNWSEYRLYQDSTNGGFFSLYDSGCSCNYFEEDSATQAGPFYTVANVVQDYTGGYGADVDSITKLITVIDEAQREYSASR